MRSIVPQDPIENVLTVPQIRDQSVAPRRLNAALVSSFGVLAVIIAAVGIAGVLAFSVSARTAEFGVRLAVGANRGHLLAGVLAEGLWIASMGIAAGAAGGYALASLTSRFFASVEVPGVLPLTGAAAVLIGAAVVASLMPAARASRVDVLQALRSE